MLEIKNGTELQDTELSQMRGSILREFGVEFDGNDLNKKTFFLLKDVENILAMGGLFEVKPVLFEDQRLKIFGVIEVVSNKKGEGYGKEVMTAIRNWLIENSEIGLGYCMPKNAGFYEKCGFAINTDCGKRFVFKNNGLDIRNQDGQLNFYQDTENGTLEKILSKNGDIEIPTDKLW